MSSTRRVLLVLVVLAAALAWPAAAASAQTGASAAGDDAVIVLVGDAVVGRDDRVHTVMVGAGDALIAGSVDDVFVGSGDVTVRGEVTNGVVAFDGRVTVEPGATVAGDVSSSVAPTVADGAEVGGEVRTIDAAAMGRVVQLSFGIYWWVATTVSLLVLAALWALLLPRSLDTVVATGVRDGGAAALTGLVVAVGLPIIAVLIGVTLVGLPLAFGLLSMIGPLFVLGLLSAGAVLGRVLLRRDDQRVGATLLGVGLLQLVAIIPFVAPLLILAAMYGAGSAAVAAYRHGRPVAPPLPAPPTPLPTAPAT